MKRARFVFSLNANKSFRVAIRNFLVRINSHLRIEKGRGKKKNIFLCIYNEIYFQLEINFRKFLLAYQPRCSHDFARVNLNVKFKRCGDWLRFANDDVSWHLERRDADVFDWAPVYFADRLFSLRDLREIARIAKDGNSGDWIVRAREKISG